MLAKFGDQTWSRKGVGIFERSNSNSFDLKSNGLNRKWGLGRSKNVRIFGGAPEYDERIYVKVGNQELRYQRHWDNMQVCYGDFQIKEIFNIAP